MKKRLAAAVTSAVFMLSCASAFADGSFLCMRADENIAITADENGNYKYIDMTASNGENVYPQISTNGNTYLPFRYICEMAGLHDGAGISGELPDGYFRYWGADPSIPGDKQKIEIKYNGNYYCHNVGEQFQYEANPGDVRTVSIYNIRGSLYFPMTYMAKITDSRAIWHGGSGRIIYASNSLNAEDYLNDSNNLRRDKELYLGFDFYNNNLGNSPLYLKSNGTKVQSLSEEIEGNPKVKSVTRSGKDIYFVNEDGRVNIKNEYSAEVYPINFTNGSGESVDVIADTAVVVRNRIYGIQVNSAGEKSGRLFVSKLDGSGFEYLNSINAYNLIVKKYRGDYYLFFGDASTKSNIHMTELKTGDDYEIQITNFEHENLLSNMEKFIIGDKIAAYIDGGNKLHVVDLADNLEEFEIIRVSNENHKIFLNGEDGESLDNITSINYDYINNVLYISQVDYTGRTYYYTRDNGGFRRLERSEHQITDIALFSDLWYNDICAKTVNRKPQINKVYFNGDGVEISE